MHLINIIGLPVPFFRTTLLSAIIIVFIGGLANAQRSKPDSLLTIPMVAISAGMSTPGGDMSQRYGNMLEIGGSFLIKTKSNWLLGLDAHYMHTANVKEDVLADLRNESGAIMGADGIAADVRTTMRGIKMPVIKAGRLFSLPFAGGSVNSGLFATIGAGFMQHKMHFEDVTRNAPMVGDDYKKGYDRLTNGWILSEQVGYMFLAKNRRINFFLSYEFTQGFTENRRSYDFVTKKREDEKRLDTLHGFKFGWIFPIYRKLPADFYYQ